MGRRLAAGEWGCVLPEKPSLQTEGFQVAPTDLPSTDLQGASQRSGKVHSPPPSPLFPIFLRFPQTEAKGCAEVGLSLQT